MEKINFNQVRGFSDSITLTFNFIKQELKPLLKTFAIIALPVIFIDLFLRSFMLQDAFALLTNPVNHLEPTSARLMNSALGYLSMGVMYFWMSLIGIAYVRIYQDKYKSSEDIRVTPGEVWGVMWRNLGKAVVWDIIYLLMVILGTVFFIVPGIYLAVIFFFGLYFMIIQNKSISAGMADSAQLIKGNWWRFFGYVIVLNLIVSALSYVFSIPYMVLTVKTVFTQQIPGTYELTFGFMLANIGQNLLQLISIIGVAVCFFSYLEQREHTELLSKIDQIGNSDPQMPEREEMH